MTLTNSEMALEDSRVVLQLPSSHGKKTGEYAPPSNSYILGSWHLTHSSRKWWKGKRNASITFQEFCDTDGIVKIDELVRYQTAASKRVNTLRGIDTPKRPGAWRWRTVSKLAMATPRDWEILGFGNVENHQWLVVYFSKTLFDPAGMDLYSGKESGLPKGTVVHIFESLKALGSDEMEQQVDSIAELQRSNATGDSE